MSEIGNRHCTSALPRNENKISLCKEFHIIYTQVIFVRMSATSFVFFIIFLMKMLFWMTHFNSFNFITSLDETVLVWWSQSNFFNKGTGVFCPERISVFTRQWRWKSYFFSLSTICYVCIREQQAPHTVL